MNIAGGCIIYWYLNIFKGELDSCIGDIFSNEFVSILQKIRLNGAKMCKNLYEILNCPLDGIASMSFGALISLKIKFKEEIGENQKQQSLQVH